MGWLAEWAKVSWNSFLPAGVQVWGPEHPRMVHACWWMKLGLEQVLAQW